MIEELPHATDSIRYGNIYRKVNPGMRLHCMLELMYVLCMHACTDGLFNLLIDIVSGFTAGDFWEHILGFPLVIGDVKRQMINIPQYPRLHKCQSW